MFKKIFSIFIIAFLGISVCITTTQVEAKKESKSVTLDATKSTYNNKQTSTDKKQTEKVTKKETKTEDTKKADDTKKNETKKSEPEKKNSETNKSVPEIIADGKANEEDFVVIVNNIEIKFGEDLNQYIDRLGKPDDFTQARSCLHDGDDKIYVYGDVTLYTYPNGKKDILYIAEYCGETKTKSGINNESTKDDVIKAYGKTYVEDNVFMTYTIGDYSTISFQFEDGKVTYIELFKEE